MLISTAKLLRPFFIFILLLIFTLSVSRVGFGLWQLDRFGDIYSFATLIFNGIRIDLSTIAYLLIVPAIIHPWIMLFSPTSMWWLKSLKVIFISIIVSILFFELATPAFIIEYGFRPNRLFIEYLVYPNEVIKMLLNGHLLTLIIVSILLVLMTKIYWKLLNKVIFNKEKIQSVPCKSAILSFFILLLALFLCARGTVGHRPINPSFVYFSTDPLINSLTLNSIYSVAYAYKQLGNEKNASKMYGKMDVNEVIKYVRHETGLDTKLFTSSTRPSLMTRRPFYRGKPKNLVIILEESLGAQFVSSLGGLPLTPQLDKLTKEGWAFKNLYATGTRSVRGIEAVITGFTPTLARAVVKLDKSQSDFFTIANLLKSNNYNTQFIYGGESHFDNMKSFFLGNGFTDIVDYDDIEAPEFIASWGASDGDLFHQANIELNKLEQSKKPFFSFIFTSSNHDPFEVPQGITSPIKYTNEQLEQYDSKEKSRHKAIQYADFALGKFIAKAKTQPYWEDTVFLIVADHDARASGKDLIPINNFHIPGVILNSGKTPAFDERVISQIDLPPTLLSLIGIDNVSPMIGHDLNVDGSGGRAMMQYAENFAYMQGRNVSILQPQKEPLSFIYDVEHKKLISEKLHVKLAETALAHALWGSLAYENQWYQ